MLVRIMGYCTHPTIPIDVNSDIIRDDRKAVLHAILPHVAYVSGIANITYDYVGYGDYRDSVDLAGIETRYTFAEHILSGLVKVGQYPMVEYQNIITYHDQTFLLPAGERTIAVTGNIRCGVTKIFIAFRYAAGKNVQCLQILEGGSVNICGVDYPCELKNNVYTAELNYGKLVEDFRPTIWFGIAVFVKIQPQRVPVEMIVVYDQCNIIIRWCTDTPI